MPGNGLKIIYKNALKPSVSNELQKLSYAEMMALGKIGGLGLSKDVNNLSYTEAKTLENMFRDAEMDARIEMDKRAMAEAASNKKEPEVPDLRMFEGEKVDVPANNQRAVLSGGNSSWNVDWDVAEEARQKAGFESQDVRKQASREVSNNVHSKPAVIEFDPVKAKAHEGLNRYNKTLNEGDKRTKDKRYDDLMSAKDLEQRIINNEIGFGDDLIYFMDFMNDMLPEETEAFRQKLWRETNYPTGKLRVSDDKSNISALARTSLRTPSQNARAKKLKETFNAGRNVAGVETNEIVPRVEKLANGIANFNSDEQIMETFRRIYGPNVLSEKDLQRKMKTVNGKKEILEKIAHAILIMALSKGENKTDMNIG